MGFPLLKKLAIAIALIDLFLAVNDSRNAGRFFLLLTMSSTFDLVPDSILHKHCQDELLTVGGGRRMNNKKFSSTVCKEYSDILIENTHRSLQQSMFALRNNNVNNLNVTVYYDQESKYSCARGGRDGEMIISEDNKHTEKYSATNNKNPSIGRRNRNHNLENVHQLKTQAKNENFKKAAADQIPRVKREDEEIREKSQKSLVNSKMYVNVENVTVNTEPLGNLNQTATAVRPVKNDEVASGSKTLSKQEQSVAPEKAKGNANAKQGDKNPPWRAKLGKDSSLSMIPMFQNRELGLSMMRHYPGVVTKFVVEGMLSEWPCVLFSVDQILKEKNISLLSSPEAQKITLGLQVDPFRIDTYQFSGKRLKAAQQLLFDHPWQVVYDLYSSLPGSFTRAFIVITLYTWLWGTVIAAMLLIGALTDDQTTLHGWIIFNILYSLLQFMMDQWIHSNIQPHKSRLVIWLFLLYSVYKPISALIGFSRWSECVVKKTTWIFPDGVLSVNSNRKILVSVAAVATRERIPVDVCTEEVELSTSEELKPTHKQDQEAKPTQKDEEPKPSADETL